MTPEEIVKLAEGSKNTIKDIAKETEKRGKDTMSTSIIYWMLIVFLIFFIASSTYDSTIGQKNLIKGIKKELNIDDLQEKIIELDIRVERLTNSNIEATREMKRLKASVEATQKKIDSGKEFSNQEMYDALTNRFQLSIVNIADELIETVEENHLFINKNVILGEIEGNIKKHIYKGRNAIYAINFDRRLLDVVFEQTDKSIVMASNAVKQCFNEFYAVGEDNITENDYKLLKRKIKSVANSIRLGSDKMLRQLILNVDR